MRDCSTVLATISFLLWNRFPLFLKHSGKRIKQIFCFYAGIYAPAPWLKFHIEFNFEYKIGNQTVIQCKLPVTYSFQNYNFVFFTITVTITQTNILTISLVLLFITEPENLTADPAVDNKFIKDKILPKNITKNHLTVSNSRANSLVNAIDSK